MTSKATAYFSRKMLITVAFGFSSGLPLALVFGTLSLWLKDYSIAYTGPTPCRDTAAARERGDASARYRRSRHRDDSRNDRLHRAERAHGPLARPQSSKRGAAKDHEPWTLNICHDSSTAISAVRPPLRRRRRCAASYRKGTGSKMMPTRSVRHPKRAPRPQCSHLLSK